MGLVLLANDGRLGWVSLAIGLWWAINGWLQSSFTELAITNKRVIAKSGIVRRRTVELLHSKVEGLSVEQGIFGRVFDFGTVVVNGIGAGRTPIPAIAGPLNF